MTKEELRQLLICDETYRIERTVSTNDMDKFQEAICAFSNDLPGSRKKGYLLIGVHDDGTLSGLQVNDQLMTKISGIRSDGNILPLPVMNTEKISTSEGDVLVVEVTPSFATPVRYRGRTFVRVGPRRDIASAEEERILSERSMSSLPTFDMMPCWEATLADIDIEAIRNQYMPRAIDAEILSEDRRELKEQLTSLRLYSRQYDCPSMAAIILFGKNPRFFLPGCYVQFVRFAGKDKGGEILNEREFQGNLFTMLPRLEMFANDAIVTQRPVPVSLFREKTVCNYPKAALRELLNNAIMHRTYQSNTPIRLYQFDDRIEIMNAGGLYGEARPENFPTVNAYRNPIIAEAMKVMKYVNMFNRGISRVQEYLEDNGSEPARFFVDKLTVFEVCVEDANLTDMRRYGANANEQITPQVATQVTTQVTTQVKALIDIFGDTPLTRIEILEKLSLANRVWLLKGYIKPALRLGLIEMTIPDKPNSRLQQYRLTSLGLAVKEQLA
ncbi:MAG: putative DNA binding domain-containing protein [Mediterranea sp.]|jgi:ATP-dependent DNA helicase RecG|nr:putative DNA binding domain-containing protein [Mediterranea sp.]